MQRQAVETSCLEEFERYRSAKPVRPLFFRGDSLEILHSLPVDSFDCCMTSPPYWGQRQYAAEGIGLERGHREYISNLAAIIYEIKRVLRATGSFWLNLGDTYQDKKLLGIPWRVALLLADEQGWILRNDVIWNKVKGCPDNARDKLRTVHEHVFHFVKQKSYYYDVDAIRSTPRRAMVRDGAVITATGVTGVRYKRQIELSAELTEQEKRNAYEALEEVLGQVKAGKLPDFRMIIRGHQRTTHSDAAHLSGRARELQQIGYYFLRYDPNGSKPGDVWDIIPEDTQKRKLHFAPYPEDLCRIPILATCPGDGIVLDPFCGTGTTSLVAFQLGRKSVGIDTSAEYLQSAGERCSLLL